MGCGVMNVSDDASLWPRSQSPLVFFSSSALMPWYSMARPNPPPEISGLSSVTSNSDQIEPSGSSRMMSNSDESLRTTLRCRYEKYSVVSGRCRRTRSGYAC